MKKIFAAVVGTALFLGAAAAQAMPVTVQITQAGYNGAADCATIAGYTGYAGASYSGGTGGVCTLGTYDPALVTGLPGGPTGFYYGDYLISSIQTRTAPSTGFVQPEFWLTVEGEVKAGGNVGQTLSVGSFVQGYTQPGSGTSVPDKMVNMSSAGTSVSGTSTLYISNSGNPYLDLSSPAGAVLNSFAFDPLTPNGSAQPVFNYSGASYNLAWVTTLTSTDAGHFNVNSTVGRVPAPAPLALLGFGLAALARFSRKGRRA